MKNKFIVSGILVALLMPGTHAFAHFKGAALSAKNLANLERVIADASRAQTKAIIVNVPKDVVKSGKIALTRAKIPNNFTPVTASLINFSNRPIFQPKVWGKEHAVLDRNNQIVGKEILVGRGFYWSSTSLARDLNTFYGGKGTVWVSRRGDKVKIYALPVNGILYQPAGFAKPLVLNSEEYFVTYDIKTQQGQVLANIPSVYGAYTPLGQKEETSLPPVSKKKRRISPSQHFVGRMDNIAPADNRMYWRKNVEEWPAEQEQTLSLKESLKIYSKYHQSVAQLRQTGETEQWWQAAGLDKQYSTGGLLGEAVVRFYSLRPANLPVAVSVKQVASGKKGKIYELPVDGLKIQLNNGRTVAVNPEESVLFHSQNNAFMLIKRSQLEDIQSFEVLAR